MSSSFARNSTKAAWTSSRGGAGKFEPVLGFAVEAFGFGVGRGTGDMFDGPAPSAGPGGAKPGGRDGLLAMVCIGVP